MARDAQLLELAKFRVEKRKDFHTHLVTYLLVNGIFWGMHLYASPESFPWPVFITLFWGVGIVLHAMDAYRSDDTFSAAVEREYQKLLKRRDGN